MHAAPPVPCPRPASGTPWAPQAGKKPPPPRRRRAPSGASRPAAERAPSGSRTGFRILLVEDDPATQEVYRDILIHEGFDVSTADDGGDAVRIAREVLPDLILMDINLPSVNGWEATKMLKDDVSTQRIPVVAISANSARENFERAASSGFEAYFAKPISPREVLAEVQRLMGRRDS